MQSEFVSEKSTACTIALEENEGGKRISKPVATNIPSSRDLSAVAAAATWSSEPEEGENDSSKIDQVVAVVEDGKRIGKRKKIIFDKDGREKLKRKRRKDKKKKHRKEDENDNIVMSYRFVKNLRVVDPYRYTFKTHAKGRWLGRPLIDVLTDEFRRPTPEETRGYFVRAIESGVVTLNGVKVDPKTPFRNGDLLRHVVHRHEPPVLAEPIEIVESNADFVVISKPPTIPVHPCGAYHFNSITEILKQRLGFKVYPVQRLDRLTSGLLVLAKSSSVATKTGSLIQSRSVTKKYIARVCGSFPISETEFSATFTDPRCAESEIRWTDDSVSVTTGIRCVDPRKGVYECHPDGKVATSIFRRRSSAKKANETKEMSTPATTTTTTVVECQPVTGRTHQLRLHLQFLGFPIANDAHYGGDGGLPYGSFSRNIGSETAVIENAPSSSGASSKEVDTVSAAATDEDVRRLCQFCKKPDLVPLCVHSEGIWLHASVFETSDLSFSCDDPGWATGVGSGVR